jgi:hypothetical protein
MIRLDSRTEVDLSPVIKSSKTAQKIHHCKQHEGYLVQLLRVQVLPFNNSLVIHRRSPKKRERDYFYCCAIPIIIKRMSTANASSPNHVVDVGADKGEETPPTIAASQRQVSSRRLQQPALLERFLASPSTQHPSSSSGYGILCNDPSGLCLSATGSFLPNNRRDQSQSHPHPKKKKLQNLDDAVNTGVFTSLTKLAHQLQPSAATTAVPFLITLEYEKSNLLIKEYDGHAIALKVPALKEVSPEVGAGATTGNSTLDVANATNGSS